MKQSSRGLGAETPSKLFQIWTHIWQRQNEGENPSIRQMANDLGYANHVSVYHFLNVMQANKMIARKLGKKRITLLPREQWNKEIFEALKASGDIQ